MAREFKYGWLKRLKKEELLHLIDVYQDLDTLERQLHQQAHHNKVERESKGDWLCWPCYTIYEKSTEEVK